MTFHLPIIIRSSRRRHHDLGGRGALHGPRNEFRLMILRYRNYLSIVEMYGILHTHAEMRRVQEMLYIYIIQNGGRLIKSVPGRTGYYYVLSRHAAMTVMARMLYEGPNVVQFGATLPIEIFPVDDINDDDDDDLNVIEAYRQFQNS